MGESWSDLDAVEYLNENGYVPVDGENPFAVGPYVTGDKQAGHPQLRHEREPAQLLRRRLRLRRPARAQVHADGEIWSATNYDVRQAFDRPLRRRQRRAADGVRARRPAGHRVPGQPALDPADVRRVAADADRHGEHGRRPQRDARRPTRSASTGSTRTSSGTRSPRAASARRRAQHDRRHRSGAGLRLAVRHRGDAAVPPDAATPPASPRQLFVGQYEARATPVADTDPSTPLDDTFPLVPGTYEFVARGNGFGATRFTADGRAGQLRDLTVNMRENLASAHERRDRDRRRHQPRSADRRHGGDELGLARRAGRGQAGDRAARPVGARAHDPARAGQRAAAHAAAGGPGRRHGGAEPLHGAAAVRDPHLRGPRRRSTAARTRSSSRPSRARPTRSRPTSRARVRRR